VVFECKRGAHVGAAHHRFKDTCVFAMHVALRVFDAEAY